MDNFTSYILRQAYQKAARLGDRLAKLDEAMDWEAFRPIARAWLGGCYPSEQRW